MSGPALAGALGSVSGWLPASASANAGRVDALFFTLLGLCGTMALVLMVLIVTFAVRYRQGSPADRSDVPVQARLVEWTWTVIPLLLFIGLFCWAAYDYLRQNRAPADAVPVFVVAKQWMWTLEHSNGRREINVLHVPLGQPVRLLMTSQDVIHSFYVPAFRLKQDLVPGRYTALSFTATLAGTFPLFCAEYCGTEHSVMRGRVVVMTPPEFAAWLAGAGASDSLATRGAALFRSLGCSGCHAGTAAATSAGASAAAGAAAGTTVTAGVAPRPALAPSLAGLLGSIVRLQDGRNVVADENYVRDAVLAPRKDIVAGYPPIMPSYAGQLSEQDMLALIAYLRSAPDELVH